MSASTGGARQLDRRHGAHGRVRDRDDFVARADPGSPQRHQTASVPLATPASRQPEPRRELAFEGRDFLARM